MTCAPIFGSVHVCSAFESISAFFMPSRVPDRPPAVNDAVRSVT